MTIRATKDQFIEKSRKVHCDRYDYSKVEYVNSKSKVTIICKIHGEFLQVPSDHYLSGCGCQECDTTKRLTTELFIQKSNVYHNNKYDYSKSIYGKNNYVKVVIICPHHGEFAQTPWAHMRGQGCPDCCNNQRSTTKEFIEKSNLKHNNLYDYSLVKYKTKKDKVIIICPNHGRFDQKAYVHLQGHGCSICNNSKLEIHLRKLLLKNKIEFTQNKRYNDCRNVLPLPFDFHLTSQDILIECDGIQHRKPIDHFGGKERLIYQKTNDGIKNKYCEDTDIKLLRVNSFKEINDLLNEQIGNNKNMQ